MLTTNGRVDEARSELASGLGRLRCYLEPSSWEELGSSNLAGIEHSLAIALDRLDRVLVGEDYIEQREALRDSTGGAYNFTAPAPAVLAPPRTLKEQAERGGLMMPEVELELSRLEDEVNFWKRSAREWRTNHAEATASKRRLSAKYGAIMARKPAARYRRIKRCVTKVTHKLRQVR